MEDLFMAGPPSYVNAKRRPFFYNYQGETIQMDLKELIFLAIFIVLFATPFIFAYLKRRKK
jgi:hypothetical protein